MVGSWVGGADVGVGVVVFGESSARGMELVTRSEARGRVLVSLGGERDSLAAASSHAARAEGSTGQADCGGLFGGG